MNFQLTPIVRMMLFTMIGIHVLILILSKSGIHIHQYLALHNLESGNFFPTQLFTSMLVHADNDNFMHLIFNMLMFVNFGPRLEAFMGSKRFGNFIIISGIGVGTTWLLWNYFMGLPPSSIVGFSGVLMGIFALTGLYFPDAMVMLLIPPIPMKMKHMVLGYIGLEFFLLMQNSPNDHVSHIAHLLGVVFGVIMYKIWHKY